MIEDVAVPFITCGNRQYLSCLDIERNPELKDFVNRFPKCFEYSINMDALLFYPEGDSPRPIEEARVKC